MSLLCRATLTGAALSAAFLAVACGEATAPGATGQLQVMLAEGSVSSDSESTFMPSGGEQSAILSIDAISSIHLTLDAIEALPSGGQEMQPGAWISLSVEGDGSLELLELGSEGVMVAQGTVPAGSFHNVRLRFSHATVTLSETIALPSGLELEPGTYDLRIPGGERTGVKVAGAAFTVSESESETVTLEIDTPASVQTIVWSAQGLMMSPVLTPQSSD